MASETQSFSNHARYYPLWHFFAFPVLAGNVAVVGRDMFSDPSISAAWDLAVALALLATVYTARTMALCNQDRIIAHEERTRLLRLMPGATPESVSRFTRSQLIGLRFASDDELPGLAQRVLDGDFENQKAIKQAVQNWRPDLVRV